MFRKIALCICAVYLAACFISCGKKDDSKTDGKRNDSLVNSLIRKDPSGKDKVMMKYIVKKGDKLSYRMTAKTSTMDNSPATNGKDVVQDNEINYVYTKEATEVDGTGIITYRVNFDSISISAKQDSQFVVYKSNVKDSVQSNPAFLQYNSVVNVPFFIRVSAEGEITDVYGIEKIYENLFKALGDTLKEEEKAQIKESFGKEQIKEILQQEYQTFPKNEVPVDSNWVKTYNTQLLVFNIVNSAKYTLKGIEEKDGAKLCKIDAMLTVDFLNKEATEKGMKLSITNSETSGSGKITFNLTRGCITSKETMTTLKLDLKMTAQGQSANSKQSVITNLSVTLLN